MKPNIGFSFVMASALLIVTKATAEPKQMKFFAFEDLDPYQRRIVQARLQDANFNSAMDRQNLVFVLNENGDIELSSSAPMELQALAQPSCHTR